MLDSKDVEKTICKMLDMGDEELLAEMERSFQQSDECYHRINDTLEEMMQEVDRLITRIDSIENKSPQDMDEESSTR